MVTDLENPDSIIITSDARLQEIAEEQGLDIDEFATILEEDEDPMDLLEWGGNDDDDKGGGYMQ